MTFWIILCAMALVWFITPKDDNLWSVVDEKPKRYKWYTESSIRKKQYNRRKKKGDK